MCEPRQLLGMQCDAGIRSSLLITELDLVFSRSETFNNGPDPSTFQSLPGYFLDYTHDGEHIEFGHRAPHSDST
jgi:hypothetical protein